MRALAAEARVAEAMQRTPVVNVGDTIVNVPEQAPPVVQVAPSTAEVRVDVAAPIVNVTAPDTQNVNIVGLPPMRAQVNRDRNGRVSSVTEG